ncbi:MAG: MFS transporter [Desulfocapsaceae bacterium]|nr:MFS transporter [Desulfocapsaceae bacterium]
MPNSEKNIAAQGKELPKIFWSVILLTTIFFLNFVTRQLIGPSLPAIEVELSLTHTQSGLFVLLTGAGFCLSQLSAAFLIAKWGYKRCILISLWGTAVATVVVATSEHPWSLSLGFLGLGVVGGLYIPAGIALITILVQPKDWGKAMGIHETAPNLALISVPFIATGAILVGSWRFGYLLTALALAILGIVYAKIGINASQNPSSPNIRRIQEVVTNASFWKICLLLSIAVGVETGIYAMTPLFLVTDKGYALADANQLLGLSRIPGPFLVLISGWLTDRLNPAIAVAIALAITGASIICLGAGADNLIVPAIFMQAAASACIFPPILSMASAISTSDNRALTFSLSIAVAPVIGSGLLPAALGLTADLASFSAGFIGCGLLIFTGIFLVRR